MTSEAPAALDLERDLNPEQIDAVTHGGGPQLVLAGAGSGKTRVITYRIAWLVREQAVDPAAITAVTFTNKAAAEMRERVENLLATWPLATFVGTFHRWALVQLRRFGERVGLRRDFAILDAADQLGLVEVALEREGLSDTAFPPRAVLAAISGAKNRLLDPAAYEARADHYFARKAALVYRRYQGLAAEAGGIDFDDMLTLSVRLMEREPEVLERLRRRARHLLVDEYQDTNHAQLRLIEILGGPDPNLTAVGDEDQGIYRWRGAELENILRFEAYFPGATVRKLERNYRSTQNILDASGALIAHNQGRRGKRLWTDAGAGARLALYKAGDEGDEARWIVNALQGLRRRLRLADMAILVRTNAQTRAIEEELLRQEVPYVLVGGTRFYERAEIKDLIAYLRVVRNPRDSFSMARIINQPPRGIGKATIELLHAVAADLGQPVWDVVFQEEFGNLPARSAKALGGFRDLVVDLQRAAEELPLPALLDHLLEATRYTDLYPREDAEDQARRENIREFLSAAQEFTEKAAFRGDEDLLTAFLDHVSLVADLDGWQPERGVSLMTLHSAKGLEFSAVAVGGLEDGLLPHFNSQGAREDLEEERRLLYVGMTRAKERLFLSACRRRRIAGRFQDRIDSPFLAELPAALIEVQESPSLYAADRGDPAGGVYSFFGRSGPAAPGAMSTRELAARGEATARAVRRGSRVRHPSLGEGIVLDLDGEGEQAKLTVYFQRAGKRKLVARYANLELL
jgi:DNA helicase-2/ATP-dependent DNA helicase PcrA